MKKSKELLLLQQELLSHIEIMETLTNQYIKKIKQEYAEIVFDAQVKLLQKVASGENLNAEKLRQKYLKNKKMLVKLPDNVNNEDLLDKIEIDGNTFYYENRENGSVFDVEYKQVGSYLDNQIVFTKKQFDLSI
jgi:hypothetical protein